MSDRHRAVQSEIDSFRPDRTPPFGVLQARKRTRDRRRYALSGTALSVAAVGVVSALPGDRLATPDTAAAPATEQSASADGETATFLTVRYRDAGFVSPGTRERLDACLSLPGVEHIRQAGPPPIHKISIADESRHDEFTTCVVALAADGVVLTHDQATPQ